MNLKKPSSLYALSTSLPGAPRHSSWPTCSSRSPQQRPYATVKEGKDDIPPWPSSTTPTPYDIFAISHTDPYKKKRFYQLVKLYHPDLQTSLSHLPLAVRLERYRLIVAANDLLSDPQKRRLYDNHGHGWNASSPASIRNADRAWRSRPGNAAMNATWEDWERWYEANGYKAPSERQATAFMPNGTFAMLIAMMCIVGAMLQSSRAEKAGGKYMDTVNAHNQLVGQEVRRSTALSAGMSQDERVGRFLRDRENVQFHFAPAKFDQADRDTERDADETKD